MPPGGGGSGFNPPPNLMNSLGFSPPKPQELIPGPNPLMAAEMMMMTPPPGQRFPPGSVSRRRRKSWIWPYQPYGPSPNDWELAKIDEVLAMREAMEAGVAMQMAQGTGGGGGFNPTAMSAMMGGGPPEAGGGSHGPRDGMLVPKDGWQVPPGFAAEIPSVWYPNGTKKKSKKVKGWTRPAKKRN